MKASLKYVLPIAVAGFAFLLPCMAGPGIIITPPSVVVTVPVPPPVVVVPSPVVVVPDTYVWDGDEYVGCVGDQYYYLGPGNVWVVMDPPRLARFQGWQRDHADWRDHGIRNVKYRPAPHKEAPQPQHEDHQDHPNNDRDHDRGHNPPQ